MTGQQHDDDPRRPADLEVSLESMRSFANDLDARLQDMQDSPTRMDDLALADEKYGGALPAATELSAKYEAARARLQEFMRVQLEAIEALGIATRLAEGGYQGTEDEQRQRLREITAGWRSVYASEDGADGAADQPPGAQRGMG